tara:strand:+ start:45 stop:206 length:162 start_codon:yes stop_codon:yes gene_type:complete
MTNKKLAEKINNAVWSANNNHITPFDPDEPLDWLGNIILYGAFALMFYAFIVS